MSKADLKYKVIEIFRKDVLNSVAKNFAGMKTDEVADHFGIGKTSFFKYSTSDDIQSNTLVKIALRLWEADFINVEDKKNIKEYLQEMGIKVGEKSNHPQHALNWYLERFSSVGPALELFVLLFSEYGLDDDAILSETQKEILKEMLSLGFVGLTPMGSYRVVKEFGDEFELRRSYHNILWDIALKHAELKFTETRMIQNFINQDEILIEDLDIAKNIYKEFENKMNELIVKTKGTPKTKRSLIFWGAIFTEFQKTTK